MSGSIHEDDQTTLFRTPMSLISVLLGRFFSTAALYVVLPFAVVVYPNYAYITPAVAAILVGCAIVFGRLLALPAGRLVDQYGSQVILMVALSIIACAGILFYLLPNCITIILQLLALSVGSPICNIAYRVIIANSVTKKHQSTAFGFLASSNNIGIVIAPLIATVLVSLGWLSEIGIASALLSVASLIILARVAQSDQLNKTEKYIKPDLKQASPNQSLPHIYYYGMLSNVALSWAFLQAIIVSLAQYSELNFQTIIPASVFFSVQAATVIPLLPIAGKAVQSITLRNKLILFHVGTIIIPVAMIVFAMFTPTYAIIAAIFLALLITASEALCMPTLDTLIASTTAINRQGRAFGNMITAQAIGMGIGTGLGGILVASHANYFTSNEALLVIGIIGSVLVFLSALTVLKT